MPFSLKNLSIRTQVLLPVLFTMVVLVIALWLTQTNLVREQQAISDNTHALVRYKDTIAQVDDTIYPLRISAVYAIYDAERRNNFVTELRDGLKEVNSALSAMEQDAQFSSDVRVAKQCIENYVAESQKMVALFNRLDQGMATAEEANAFIQNFRETGTV